MYGEKLAALGTSATAVATAWQTEGMGSKLVMPFIDFTALGKQAAAGMEAARWDTFGGQAAAGLLSAGTPLTAENMSAAIDKLAAKDGGVVPSLANINAAIAAAGGTSHTDFTNTIMAINNVTTAINNKAASVTGATGGPATSGPSVTLNIHAGAVQVTGGNPQVNYNSFVSTIMGALTTAASRMSLPAGGNLAGAR